MYHAYAHDLPSNDPSDYIRPWEPEVMKLANDIWSHSKTMLDRVRNAYYWVSWNIRYMWDRDRWGVDDYWQLPSTTIKLGTGDCEDHAILLTSLLRALGLSRDNVHLVFGYLEDLLTGKIYGHAWVEIKIPEEIAQGLHEIALQVLNTLEGKTIIICTERESLYVNVTRDFIHKVKSLGWGDRDGWIPLDATAALILLPDGRKVPIPFSLWLALGYYVYYLAGLKAIPKYFYIDKSPMIETTVHLRTGETHTIDIKCYKDDYVSGYVNIEAYVPTLTPTTATSPKTISTIVTATSPAPPTSSTVVTATSVVFPVSVLVKIIDPKGSVVSSFRLDLENRSAYFGFRATIDGFYKLVLENNGSYDVLLSVCYGKNVFIILTQPIKLDEYVVRAEYEYINSIRTLLDLSTLTKYQTTTIYVIITTTIERITSIPIVHTRTILTTMLLPTTTMVTVTTTMKNVNSGTYTQTVITTQTLPLTTTKTITTSLPTTVTVEKMRWDTALGISLTLLIIGLAIGSGILRKLT